MSDGNSFADVYNIAGAQGMFGQNPYLQFQGKIPMPGFRGVPTDAMGGRLQSFTDAQAQHDAWAAANPAPPAAAKTPGTTMNNTGWNQNPVGSPLNPAGDWTQLAPKLPGANQQQQANYAYNLGLGGFTDPSTHQAYIGQGGGAGQAGSNGANQGQSGSSQAQNPVDMRQAYLDALSNPGPIKQSGAVMQPGAQPTGGQQPSVLDAFLAAHPGGGSSIPGGYSNTSFFDTLGKLQAQKQGATA